MAAHEKWVTERSAMGIRDFADWYRFGEGGAAPLVHYTGGSISWQAHQERFASEPTPILEEFVRAWEPTGRPRVDLVISPAPPPGEQPRPEPLESFLEYVMDELLVRLPTGGAIDHLNVSNAAAVSLYELVREGGASAAEE